MNITVINALHSIDPWNIFTKKTKKVKALKPKQLPN